MQETTARLPGIRDHVKVLIEVEVQPVNQGETVTSPAVFTRVSQLLRNGEGARFRGLLFARQTPRDVTVRVVAVREGHPPTSTGVHPPITNPVNCIDPALAVDRALNAAERAVFFERRLVGPFEGAQPADWICWARDADAYIDRAEPWWEQYGDEHMAELLARHELPESLTRQILGAALYAAFAMDGLHRPVIEIASGAALWARGYAEAHGWTPDTARQVTR